MSPMDKAKAALDAEPLLKYFPAAENAPPNVAPLIAVYRQMAYDLTLNLQRTTERTVAIRKLIESRDAAMRVALVDMAPAKGGVILPMRPPIVGARPIDPTPPGAA